MDDLEAELQECLQGLRTTEAAYRVQAQARGQDVMLIKHADGSFVMEKLLVAKAQVLSALAYLKPQLVVNGPVQGFCKNCGNASAQRCKSWCTGREIV